MPKLLDRLQLRIGRAVHRRISDIGKPLAASVCSACGESSVVKRAGVLWPELILQWRLSPAWANWMDEREGLRCVQCGSNSRSRHLAESIVKALNERLDLTATSLAELCRSASIARLSIAEINAAGDLHQFLKNVPTLRYSEYGSLNPAIPSEDLLKLSYGSSSFDLVLNSDVLEHVPDPKRALSEIRRILKPTGLFIFTVPLIWAQENSCVRAEMEGSELVHRLPPSFHGSPTDGRSDYLVFSEFGRDFVGFCERAGFKVELSRDARNPALITIIARPVM